VVFSETVVGVGESVQQLRSEVAELRTLMHQMLGSSPYSPNPHQTVPVQPQQLTIGPQPDPLSSGVSGAASTLATGATSIGIEASSTASLRAPIIFPNMSATTSSSAYRAGTDDSASIKTAATTRSIISIRSVRSFSDGFIEALNSSRVYKLVQRRRPTPNSKSNNNDASSVFSVNSGSTRLGRWSALSDLSLGDLAISEISVLELPILMSDIWDPSPYQLEQSSPTPAAKKRRGLLRLNVISSSRGQIHSAIEGNNELAVRTLLRLGTDIINEVGLNGWTPLLHAAFRCRESICQLLLEHGAGLGEPTRSGVMELTSIKAGIERAVENSENHVMPLQILLLQAIMKTEQSGEPR